MKSGYGGSQESERCAKKEEKLMKKILTSMVLIGAMSLCSLVQAFDGRSPQDILGQLPAEKEALFHQTMRDAWEATANIREQIKTLEAEIKGVLTATEFNEALFLEKAKSLQSLHGIEREIMDQAMADLASQFAAEERAILAELISRRPGPPARPTGALRLKSIDQNRKLGRVTFISPPSIFV
jgi:uncharacterized membrane protein